jgi:hypothetical protein
LAWTGLHLRTPPVGLTFSVTCQLIPLPLHSLTLRRRQHISPKHWSQPKSTWCHNLNSLDHITPLHFFIKILKP